MKLILVLVLAVILCVCVCPPVEAGFPTYDVDVCTTSIGWIDDTTGEEHFGGMCEEMYPGYESTLWDTVSIVPIVDWGEWGFGGDYAHSAWLSIPEGLSAAQVADNWIAEDIERRWLAGER